MVFLVFNKIVKPKCKALFRKLRFSKYISDIKNSKLRGIQKYMPSKKVKDFIGYGGLHMLYYQIELLINRPSKYIFLLC